MAEPSSPAPLSPAPAPPAAPPAALAAAAPAGVQLQPYLLGLAAAAALGVGAIGWLLCTESGTPWLLARVPGLQVSGVRGSLLGDFSVQRLELPLPGEGARLRLQQLHWRAPSIRAGGGSTWLRFAFDELRVQRIDLWLSSEASSDSQPRHEPGAAARAGRRRAARRRVRTSTGWTRRCASYARASAWAPTTARGTSVDERCSSAGTVCTLSGRAQVGTRGDLAVDAAVELTQQLAAPAANGAPHCSWPARWPRPVCRRPCARRPTPRSRRRRWTPRPRCSPFAAWPLGELQATARALDLSALHSAAPRTALDLDASASTQARNLPAASRRWACATTRAGRWNEGRLPLRTLSLQLQARPDDPSQIDIRTFEAELGSTRTAAGRISGSGQWNPASWQLDTRLSALRPSLLDARAPAMRLDGRLQLDGSGFDAAAPHSEQIEVRGTLSGQRLGRGAEGTGRPAAPAMPG